ncbi:uncharacterized protein LOC136750037 isoform X1 [Amia ocellicauda]|uniref:uncharacterized protein LOC136750037 isoform X1 n=1 Tax=Amia ocellicauda TaxID=2972642 RepID=UPI003464DB1D
MADPTPEMRSNTSTTTPPSLTSDQLTVIVASVSCMVFFVIILVLLTILYRKDPLCCKVRSYQDAHQYPDAPPQYHNSRQTLVGSSYGEQASEMAFDNMEGQQGQMFFIGPPGSYRLPPLDAPLPHLPSYESVRKKDRQRQIHMMIADRFGLNPPALTEPPPTYEESIRHSVEIPAVFDVSDASLPPVVHSHSGADTSVSQEGPTHCHTTPAPLANCPSD